MESKLNNKRGITLIALIITIIVLLILAVVSIKIVINQGIIKKANKAKERYTVEQEKELIVEGYSNYQIQKYAYEDSKDTTDLKKLEEYFIGKKLEELMTSDYGGANLRFVNNDVINDASTSLLLVGQGLDFEAMSETIRVWYKDNIYNVYEHSYPSKPFTKVKFESTCLGINENPEDKKILESFFNSLENISDYNNIDEKGYFKNIQGETTSIRFVGQGLDGLLVQYNDYIYTVEVNPPATCNDKPTFKGIKIESVKLSANPQLQVRDANVSGNEQNGWKITFNGTGHEYRLEPNGKIEYDETIISNEELWKIIEARELKKDEKYFITKANSAVDPLIMLPIYKESKFVGVYIFKYSMNDPEAYMIFKEDVNTKDVFGEAPEEAIDLPANQWYQLLDFQYVNSKTIIKLTTQPDSIINIPDEEIEDIELYRAIDNSLKQLKRTSRDELRKKINSKFAENNNEEITVAINRNESCDAQSSYIKIKLVNNIPVIEHKPLDNRKLYIMAMEDIQLKDIQGEGAEKIKLKKEMWYKIENNRSTKSINTIFNRGIFRRTNIG